ncbi:MAG: hypothetical protein ABI333_19220 [bacterium]
MRRATPRAARHRRLGKVVYRGILAGACDPACAPGDVCLGTQCVPEQCQSGVLHHFIDGRIASTADHDLFCAGCNLQLLYLLWYRQYNLGL